jgi:mannosyl-oligosaccharide alpha-1,2-mannosidase
MSGNMPSAELSFLVTVLMMYCSVFESTIRYLGGLISAYELSGQQHFFLIQKAQQLADRLSIGWSQVSEFSMLSETGRSDSEIFQGNTVPFGTVNFSANAPVNETVCPRRAVIFQ